MSFISPPSTAASALGPPLDPAIIERGVLIVEDSTVQRRQLYELLVRLGVGCIYEASDGRGALNLLRSLPAGPAVAIVDLEMPGMDGIEFAQLLARMPRPPAMIIVSQADTAIIEAVETMIAASGLFVLKSMRKPLSQSLLLEGLGAFRNRLHGSDTSRGAGGAGTIAETSRDTVQRGYSALRYQPRIALGSGAVVAFEIASASATGAIAAQPHWMLDQALRDLRRLPAAAAACSLALALSPASLRYGMLPNDLQAAFRGAGIAPDRLTLQIGQNSLLPEDPSVLWAINRLRVGGFGLSLDDYCSGYSSIQLLSQLPFTEIKLDRDLIVQAARGQQSRIILAAAIEMGLHLGLRTVADGVESDAQLRMLRSMGCERAQGPAVSMALDVDDVPDWLKWEAPRLPAVIAG